MKHEVSMHVGLGLRLIGLHGKNDEIALQRYESFLNNKPFSPPKMCEKVRACSEGEARKGSEK